MNRQCIVVVIALLCGAVAFPQAYEITRLGAFGRIESIVSDINDYGQVTGAVLYESTPSQPFAREAFFRSPTETTLLGQMGSSISIGNALNNHGEIVGMVHDAEQKPKAFYWSSQTGMQVISLPQETTYATSYGITNHGQMLIYARRSDEHWPIEHLVYVGHPETGFTAIDFPTPFGGVGIGVSDSGHIVGAAIEDLESFPIQRAYVWQEDQFTFLDSLGGASCLAYGVNYHGTVVGVSNLSSLPAPQINPTHAAMWQDGMVYDLGTLGGINSTAYAINDSGQIVGSAETAKGVSHACLWQDGRIIDLNDFLPADSDWEYLDLARNINIHGQIVGSGFIDGRREAFLMTPVPEPVSLVLLMLGVAFIRRS